MATDLSQGGSEMARIWSTQSHLEKMVTFESALAQAEAQAGVIPSVAADEIAAACQAWRPGKEIAQAISREASQTGTPVIPLIDRLAEHVAGLGRGYLHWGATSQDVLDTALVLQMREGLDLLVQRLLDIGGELALLAERYRTTLMAGRTLLQQALPITFGLKAAHWLALTTRQVRRLREVQANSSMVQLGGATGTLAALQGEGVPVTQFLAEQLGLTAPELPWHAERDRVAEVAAALGVAAGAMAKIALDLVLLAQNEVGEVMEATGSGQGRSSAMPQKHNSIHAIMALAASRRAMGVVPVMLGAMVAEHERSAGGWQAELAVVPIIFGETMETIDQVYFALSALQVNAERMQANLANSHGLVMAESLTMALAYKLGRPEAFLLVEETITRARESSLDLGEAARLDPRIHGVLSEAELDLALDPTGYLGSANTFIDRALAGFRAL